VGRVGLEGGGLRGCLGGRREDGGGRRFGRRLGQSTSTPPYVYRVRYGESCITPKRMD
jgi:hypothetical protein